MCSTMTRNGWVTRLFAHWQPQLDHPEPNVRAHLNCGGLGAGPGSIEDNNC